MLKTILLFFLISSFANAQISGCTDPLSKNYNPLATINNGSCQYASLKIKPQYSKKLSDSIKETSGLISFNNLLWTHNDDHDKTIYGLDSLGTIKRKIILDKVKNNDWEEISQDSTHIYIGDFGNNYAGNRTDLHILKIEKESFLEGNANIETISFQYSNQTDFSPKKQNTTNFDCEAFIVSKDSIYLFTKEWNTSKTSIYAIPNKSGNHVAQLKDTLDTKGLVTGATYLESKKLIVLCGYSKIGKPFLYLLYDYKNNAFLSGNKRRITIKLPIIQIEGIATKDGLHYYLTNESLIRKPILNIPQQIHYFDLSTILQSYLHK
ncbi:T9SS C-terminal target domain-containing protein [Flavobacterium pectinovorum]|uniref:T9SS C-terminal target domain-containing protein n=1 Tax=Flavobacterium pectinovorum TaxID=29533 RepID=A0A502EZU6_9FLAO|nr:T9SS C-terminal target domain-containing protein [Flavobacterium pectinovorum]TPG42209.1 T9SS C-terminal target domain-containing protein [Flavobacterium pectinovorum]